MSGALNDLLDFVLVVVLAQSIEFAYLEGVTAARPAPQAIHVSDQVVSLGEEPELFRLDLTRRGPSTEYVAVPLQPGSTPCTLREPRMDAQLLVFVQQGHALHRLAHGDLTAQDGVGRRVLVAVQIDEA